PKPKLVEMAGQELPASVVGDRRRAEFTRAQAKLLCVGAVSSFSRQGRSRTEISDWLPHTARIADDICLVRSLHTDAVNHAPAATSLLTGSEQPGRPAIGSWISYGLGSPNKNLPAFVVLLSGYGEIPLTARYWGNGFLPSNHQGVQFRSVGDPV